MFNCKQFKELVVEPTLDEMSMYSPEAVDLLLGTAAVESHLGTYIAQIMGPALGVYQMEPDTHDDIWNNFLVYNKGIESRIYLMTGGMVTAEDLVYNLKYATAMSRLHYLRVPEALPARAMFNTYSDYVWALAAYWKEYYNTFKGAGNTDDFYEQFFECGCAKES